MYEKTFNRLETQRRPFAMQKAVFGNVKGNLLAHKRVPFEIMTDDVCSVSYIYLIINTLV